MINENRSANTVNRSLAVPTCFAQGQEQLSRRLEKHRCFWDHQPVVYPLIGFCQRGNEVSPGYDLFRDRLITPEDLNQKLYEAFRWDFTFTSIRPDFPGELFYTPLLDCGIPWMEAAIGCPIHYTAQTRMAWAGQIAKNPEELIQNWGLPLDITNPWLKRLTFLSKQKKDDFPWKTIPPVLMRGPLDVLLTALPVTETITGLALDPAKYMPLLTYLGAATILFNRWQSELLEPLQGGFVNRRGLWAPGTICLTQEDNVSLFSPDIYTKYINPIDRQIWNESDYAMMHVHSIALHMIYRTLLESPELDGIEVMIDPQGPPAENLIPIFQAIQKSNKSLLICSRLGPEEITQIAAALEPQGLAFSISAPDPINYQNCFS